MVSREFLFNVINTIDDTYFKKNIEQALKYRKDKYNE
jgi:LytS/YehU family sensor histidine kinase